MLSSSLLASSSLYPKPFLKWAGGKTQLLKQMSDYLPEGLKNGSINRYVEPFLGGGAVFFHIVVNFPTVEEFYLLDINPELILVYKTIQANVESLIQQLLVIQNQYNLLSLQERINFFYQQRTDFNAQRKQINYQNYSPAWITRTAQIIFLNRTCYNGLFRVNSQGYFNVPAGRYKNPTICNQENLRAVSQALQKAVIERGDFELVQKFSDYKSTFIYFDPPYRPISKTANFTAYSEHTFDDQEQLRLSKVFQSLDAQGAKLLLSNSDPKNQDINDNFFDHIYCDYAIKRIKATRSINSKSNKRGQINEILIMNY